MIDILDAKSTLIDSLVRSWLLLWGQNKVFNKILLGLDEAAAEPLQVLSLVLWILEKSLLEVFTLKLDLLLRLIVKFVKIYRFELHQGTHLRLHELWQLERALPYYEDFIDRLPFSHHYFSLLHHHLLEDVLTDQLQHDCLAAGVKVSGRVQKREHVFYSLLIQFLHYLVIIATIHNGKLAARYTTNSSCSWYVLYQSNVTEGHAIAHCSNLKEIVFVIVVIAGKILLSARNRLLLELDKLGDKFLGHAIVDFLAKGVWNEEIVFLVQLLLRQLLVLFQLHQRLSVQPLHLRPLLFVDLQPVRLVLLARPLLEVNLYLLLSQTPHFFFALVLVSLLQNSHHRLQSSLCKFHPVILITRQ